LSLFQLHPSPLPNSLAVDDIYKPDHTNEAVMVFGANDPAHPSVAYLRTRVKEFYVGGKVSAIQLPAHFDYVELRCEWQFCRGELVY